MRWREKERDTQREGEERRKRYSERTGEIQRVTRRARGKDSDGVRVKEIKSFRKREKRGVPFEQGIKWY